MELFYPGLAPESLGFPVAFRDFEPGLEMDVGGLRVLPFPAVHSPGSAAYALRITCGRIVIAYSGDTAWTEALVEVSAGADLFICECHSYTTVVSGHLTYEEIRAQRSRLTCKRLVLTHFGPEMLARLNEVQEECAYDGLTVML